jgi:hypothetical protein
MLELEPSEIFAARVDPRTAIAATVAKPARDFKLPPLFLRRGVAALSNFKISIPIFPFELTMFHSEYYTLGSLWTRALGKTSSLS